MDETFQALLDSSPIWLPVLSWLLGQFSASQPGLKIDDRIKKRLKWIKNPEAEKAFQEAFKTGIERYQKTRSNNEVAIAVAEVLLYVANNENSIMDRAAILEQVFRDRVDTQVIRDVVNRTIFALKGKIVSKDLVSEELQKLITDYLRPSFRSQKYFSEIVGFAEVIGILKEIRDSLFPVIDLEKLQEDYYQKIAAKYDLLTMQGISPKVRNQTIGIRMKDVFISLDAEISDISYLLHADINNMRVNLVHDLGHITFDESRIKKINQSIKSGLISYRPEQANRISLSTIEDSIEIQKNIEPSLIRFKEMTLAIGDSVFDKLFSRRISVDINGLLRFPNIVVKGHPGSGKSTIVKYISWVIASKESEILGENIQSLVPLVIRAVEFGEDLQKGNVNSLDEYLLEQAGRFSALCKFALSAGKAFIFIDGLDEIGEVSLRSRVKERVDDFISDPAFSDNRIFITTRIVGYQQDGITGQFPHFELKELTDDQISQFIENWYQAIHAELPDSISVEDEKKQLMDAMQNPGIHRMARNPLLLTIIALIKWQGRVLPEQRVLLYDAAAQTLIKSWPLAQRSVEFDELFIREWLAPIAEKVFSNPTSDLIDEYTITEALVESMMKLKALPKLDAESQTKTLLESISLHSGIILPRGTDADGRNLFGFLHQTFAEYLTAYYFAGRWEDKTLKLENYLHDPYWLEVLLLMAGHLGTQRRAKAGQFLREIVDLQSSKYENIIHRDLILAGRMLGDAVPAPADIVEEILRKLFALWKEDMYKPLIQNLETIFGLIKPTEYCSVLARIALEEEISDEEVIRLSNLLGVRYFLERLNKILDSTDVKQKIEAATLVATAGDERGVKVLLGLLKTNSSHQAEVIGKFIVLHKNEGLISGIEKLASQFNYLEYGSLFNVVLLNKTSDILIEKYNALLPHLSTNGKYILALLANKHPKSNEILIDSLQSENKELILESARMLTKSSNKDYANKGISTFLSFLHKESDFSIRFEAAQELAKLKNPDALLVLREYLRNDDKVIKFRAAIELAKNYNYSEGRDILTEYLSSNDKLFAINADEVLRNFPDFILTTTYIQCLFKNPVPSIRLDFARRIADSIKNNEHEFVSQLYKLMNSNEAEISLGAAEILISSKAKHSRKSALSKIEFFSDSFDEQISLPATEFLISNGYENHFWKMEEFLTNTDVYIRFESSRFLRNNHSRISFDILKKNIMTMLSDFENISGKKPLGEKDSCVADIAFRFIQDNISPKGDLIYKKEQSEKTKRGRKTSISPERQPA